MITARARITLSNEETEVTETGTGCLGDFEVVASFGDYGRSHNPMLTATLKGASFVMEFSCPDDARKLGEDLFSIARKAEEKGESKGPEYRARIARDQFLAEMRDSLARLEKVLGAPITPDLRRFFNHKIEGLDDKWRDEKEPTQG